MSKRSSIFDKEIIYPAMLDSVKRLTFRYQLHNFVMLIVFIGAVVTSIITLFNVIHHEPYGFNFQITLWLWFTVLFANFAEAVAEGKGKAQAESLRKNQKDAFARLLLDNKTEKRIPAFELKKGDVVVCETGDIIPADGEIIDGVASVDESAITGESAPVIRESGGDRSGVTGGTKVLSDKIIIKITVNQGESFIDRLIGLVEGATRKKTPNEIALAILLVSLTLIFILAVFNRLVRMPITIAAMKFIITIIQSSGAAITNVYSGGMNKKFHRTLDKRAIPRTTSSLRYKALKVIASR